MRAVLAAAVAILGAGLATSANADGDDSGGAMPVIAADSNASGDGWGVASSAGVTYTDAPGAPGQMVDASDDQGVAQNYQFLDPNVLEYTQMVEGGTVVTLSGVLLQRDGDDSDAAQLDEQESGVYSAGSAVLVPSAYDAASTVLAAASPVSCTSSCDLLGSAGGATGAVKTLASYASSGSTSLQGSSSFGAFGLGSGSYFNPGYYLPPGTTVIIPVPPPASGTGGGVSGGDGGSGGGSGGQPSPPPPPGGPPGIGGNGGPGGPLAVPEPAAWVIMLVGLGTIGAVRRRRRTERPSA